MQQEREGSKEEEEENDLDPRPTSSFISYLYLSRFIQPFSISVILPLTRLFIFLVSLHFTSVISLCSLSLNRFSRCLHLCSSLTTLPFPLYLHCSSRLSYTAIRASNTSSLPNSILILLTYRTSFFLRSQPHSLDSGTNTLARSVHYSLISLSVLPPLRLLSRLAVILLIPLAYSVISLRPPCMADTRARGNSWFQETEKRRTEREEDRGREGGEEWQERSRESGRENREYDILESKIGGTNEQARRKRDRKKRECKTQNRVQALTLLSPFHLLLASSVSHRFLRSSTSHRSVRLLRRQRRILILPDKYLSRNARRFRNGQGVFSARCKSTDLRGTIRARAHIFP